MAIQALENQEEYRNIGTDISRISQVGLLNAGESPMKRDTFEHNVTSTLNIVPPPVENFLEPPDEEEYEDEEDEEALAMERAI